MPRKCGSGRDNLNYSASTFDRLECELEYIDKSAETMFTPRGTQGSVKYAQDSAAGDSVREMVKLKSRQRRERREERRRERMAKKK